MAFKLDPPPDPTTPLTSYPWTIWFTKLYRWVASYVGTITGATSEGGGIPVFNIGASTEETLAFNSLVAGTGISITGPTAGNIVITNTGSGSGIVQSIVAGDGIAVDSSDPANPIVSATGGGGGGILPVVTGEVPPVFVYLEDGSLVYTEII